jgi:microcystin-dependent protein
MSDPFVAEIRIFPFNFPPKGWAFCDGQLLPISQNTALFSLLGTFYGGDGKSTFALPDMQGNAATNQGQGGGLQEWFIGETQGSQTVTLLDSEMPIHNHSFSVTSTAGNGQAASNAQLAKGFKGNLQSSVKANMYSAAGAPQPNANMSPLALTPAGSSFPHNNMMPYLTLNFCIALQGVFPPRS